MKDAAIASSQRSADVPGMNSRDVFPRETQMRQGFSFSMPIVNDATKDSASNDLTSSPDDFSE